MNGIIQPGSLLASNLHIAHFNPRKLGRVATVVEKLPRTGMGIGRRIHCQNALCAIEVSCLDSHHRLSRIIDDTEWIAAFLHELNLLLQQSPQHDDAFVTRC